MVIYRVTHNLTYNTVQELGNYCSVSEYAKCFATKGEATKYATQIKKGVLSLAKDKRQEYKDSWTEGKEDGEYGEPVLDVSPTKYIEGCGFAVCVNKLTLNSKQEIIEALSGVRLQSFYSYDADCNPYDHYDCAVFKWDADQAGCNDVATSDETYNG